MIFYRPVDGDAHTANISYRPKTCFLMTQLGHPIPQPVKDVRESLVDICSRFQIEVIDADSVITGKDFLMKIWCLLLALPLGIAIVDKGMTHQTFANIFYEIGMMHAYGKETLVIRTKGTNIPSDFVRTEYVTYDGDFERRITKFLTSFSEQSDYYLSIAEQLEYNPLLSIDYLRRAYLISGDDSIKEKAREIFEASAVQARAKNSVEMLLVGFCK